MHETGITKKLVDMILKESEARDIKPKVAVIHLGLLSGFTEQHFRHHFDMHKVEHDRIKNTELEIVETPDLDVKLKELKF